VRRTLLLVTALGGVGCAEPVEPARGAPSAIASPTRGSAATSAPMATAPASPPLRSPVSSDEVVVVFPALAHWDADASSWRLELHLWLYEPEDGSLRRGAFVDALVDRLELAEDSPDRERVAERLQPFLVDNERGKRLSIRLGERVYRLPPTEDDGHVVATVNVPASVVAAAGGRKEFEVVMRAGDDRKFAGRAHFVPPTGRLLVSDIDDTVKITEVTSKEKLLRRTFVDVFEFVPGASDAYRQRLGPAGHLHFLSSSPFQLYTALANGLKESGFSDATFDLKRWRPASLEIDTLLADPKATKGTALERLVARFPKRRFYLVGDSGEQDPEVYGRFAEKHPEVIEHVAIRNVTGEPASAPRYQTAFASVPAERWHVFTEPKTLPR
jgi:Phosphatidate phosphatase APP1, catalytic domain